MKNFRLTLCAAPTNYNTPFRVLIDEQGLIKKLELDFCNSPSADLRFSDSIEQMCIALLKIEEQRGNEWVVHYEKTGVYPSHFSNTLKSMLHVAPATVYAE